ncbi:coiled-coil and C2 domain-containing protein 2A [Bicyclus anynana]|uniref:Coiled-coil and C2 domain-containing protein 2A n=1 Tax=Bicyclus anynana TaxID=110368 RepID=A0A6J1N477_BICAN|nr:coiled-coil and C2 domain-containing protein 2A [Bicyclus anynana]
MAENNIALHYFNKNTFQQSDSEEYHEIGHEALEETLFFPKVPVKPIKEYDFFTVYDTSNLKKRPPKKKKRRKESKSKTIIDVIHSELASKSILIENNIVIIDSKQRENYLEKLTRIHPISKSVGSRNLDAENGLNSHKIDYISPVFPRVVENNGSKESTVPVQYTEPSLFSGIASEYLESGIKQSPKFFDIVLKNIRFKHHHEFTLEKLCSLKLVEYYDKYESTANSIKELIRQIDVNRRTAISLKEKLTKISPHRKEETKYDKNVLKYTKNMVDLKEKYYHSLDEQKDNIHRIMSLWADIESIREKCGFTKTDLFLEICNKEMEQSEYEKQWNKVFEVEYSDMILKIEHDFINSYLEYKEFKRQRNEQHNIIKPKLDIDYDKLKETVESLVNSMVLKTNINLLLKRDRSLISSANNLRKSSFVNNYCFKVYVDDLFVCETDSYVCKEDHGDIDFIEHLSIEILPYNKSLSIVLFENNEEMSSFQIKLPDIKKNSIETNLMNTFVFNKIEEPSTRYIGSGYDIKEIAARNKVRLKSSNLFKGELMTSCDVNIQLGWNNKYNDSGFESIRSHMDTRRLINQLLLGKNELCLNKITEIINNLYNTNIEDNQNIMIALKGICKSRLNIDNSFNFNMNDGELIRFKLLRLRSTGGLVDSENKSIPLFTSQMSTELLSCLEKSQQKHLVYHNIKKETDNTIDVQRFVGMKFIEKLNKNVMKTVNDHLLKVTYKDVVRDYEELSLRALFSNQINLTLGAASSVSKHKLIKDSLMTEQEIYVTAYKAYNLTCRSEVTIADDEYDCDNNIAGFKIHALRPFVQVSYHGISAQTVTAIGRHPSWNQILKIKTRLEPLSSLHINIYDQCKEHLNKTYSDDQSQSTVIYRKFNKWLGTINIPMQTVLSLGNVRGTFKVSLPPLLFGYENSKLKQGGSKISELSRLMKKESSFLALQISTSISHLGGIETYRQPITNDSEPNFIIRHLNEFVTEYIKEFPTRNISLTFIDSTGKNKCVSEFLQTIPVPGYECFPIDPKKTESARSKSSGYSKSSSSKSSRKKSSNDDKESLSVDTYKGGENQLMKYVDAVVRYVSLIPTYEMVEPYVVSLMGVELLKVLYGSPLDHAILLASFFLHLQIKCWIVIGFALPRGLSGYVLVQHYRNKILKCNDEMRTTGICGGDEGFAWYIYDAVAGERYELREIGCPLKTVSYVFDSENIWVNVQSAQDCENVCLNFSKSSEWQTVFNKPLFITRPISDNLYSKPENVESLRETLETKIKNKIQKWRSHVKTIWNRYCSTLLREMLPHWEYWSFNPAEIQPNPGNRLKQFMATYKMYGFPLNVPYLNSKLIISRIKSTAIYINDDPNVEFGLGIEVYGYPNNVLSVWVFLASITRI